MALEAISGREGRGEPLALVSLSRAQQRAIAFALSPAFIVWLVNGIYLAALARVGVAYFWAADLLQWVALPALIVVALSRQGLRPAHYGMGAPGAPGRLLLASVAIFLTTGAAYHYPEQWLWHALGEPGGFFTFPGVFPDGLMGRVIWIYSALSAGVVESILFLGLPWLLYGSRVPRPSRTLFILVVAPLFALAHWEQGPHVVAGALCVQVVVSLWYFRLGSLWPVMAGHTLIDLVLFA